MEIMLPKQFSLISYNFFPLKMMALETVANTPGALVPLISRLQFWELQKIVENNEEIIDKSANFLEKYYS